MGNDIAPKLPISGSRDPFVELAHLVKRTAQHIHDFVKNKDSHLAVETSKTVAAADALTQHPAMGAFTAAAEPVPQASATEIPPAPDTPAQ